MGKLIVDALYILMCVNFVFKKMKSWTENTSQITKVLQLVLSNSPA